MATGEVWVHYQVEPWAWLLMAFAIYATGRFALVYLIAKIRARIKARGESSSPHRRVP